jgi:hypothetical protein
VDKPEDLISAFEKLQEMRESEEFCCIELVSDYAYVWDIRFVHENWQNEHGHVFRLLGSYVDLTEAIEDFHEHWKKGDLDRVARNSGTPGNRGKDQPERPPSTPPP